MMLALIQKIHILTYSQFFYLVNPLLSKDLPEFITTAVFLLWNDSP